MVFLACIFLGILGLFFGSFLNVIIDRLPRGESFITGRSHCESCGHTLSTFDLIPLFSFVMLKGKCRYCHTPLTYQYVLLELLTAFLTVLTYLSLQNSSIQDMVFYLFILYCLLVVFFIDLKSGIIPFVVVLPATVITLLYLIFTSIPSVILIHGISALLAMLFFLALFLGTRGRGMGFGDVVYAFFMGLLLGFPNIILGLYIAFLTGAGISLILILLTRKKLKGSTIPFGPFLVAGTYISLIWGELIINYFLRNII